jgi:regulator of sigma E protease
MLLTIVIFLLVLSLLVLVHELGHFFTARLFGVKAEEFGLGFPPRAIGWYKNRYGKWQKIFGNRSVESLETSEKESLRPASQATIYSFNWLPLGGFVKIKGENGDGKEENDSFSSKSISRRVVILSAGVLMNVVLAWFLFSVGYMIGLPQSTDYLGKKAQVSDSQVMIQEVLPESVAANAGLKAGDAILRVNDMGIETETILQDAVAASAGREAEILISRAGEEQIVKVTPPVKEGGRATIGIAIYSSGLVRYPFFPAIWEGAKTTGWILGQIVVAFGHLFSQVFHGDNVSDQFAGPVGIANITGQAARIGFTYLLQFIALLSLNLAIINILPFPSLDGGRIFFLLIEKIKGRPVRKEVEALIHNIGFLFLIAVIVLITYKDIVKLF